MEKQQQLKNRLSSTKVTILHGALVTTRGNPNVTTSRRLFPLIYPPPLTNFNCSITGDVFNPLFVADNERFQTLPTGRAREHAEHAGRIKGGEPGEALGDLPSRYNWWTRHAKFNDINDSRYIATKSLYSNLNLLQFIIITTNLEQPTELTV